MGPISSTVGDHVRTLGDELFSPFALRPSAPLCQLMTPSALRQQWARLGPWGRGWRFVPPRGCPLRVPLPAGVPTAICVSFLGATHPETPSCRGAAHLALRRSTAGLAAWLCRAASCFPAKPGSPLSNNTSASLTGNGATCAVWTLLWRLNRPRSCALRRHVGGAVSWHRSVARGRRHARAGVHLLG